MRKLKYLVIMMIMSSCSSLNDFLDYAPSSDLSYVKTVDDCNLLMNNPRLMFSCDHTLLMDGDIEYADVEAVFKKNTTGYNEYTFWNDGYLVLPSEDDDCWNRIYENIYTTNVVLDRIDKVDGDDNTKRSQLKGDAYLHRALYHFNLVNIYGRQYNMLSSGTDLGIPVVKDIDVNAVRERATVAQVYESVISDIENALKYLKTEKPVMPDNFRGSIAAAYGLMAKVCLNMQDWRGVIENAEKSLKIYDKLVDYNDYLNFSEYETREPSMYQPYYNVENVFLKGANEIDYFTVYISVGMGDFMGQIHFSDDFLSLLNVDSDLRYRLFMGKNMMTGAITPKKFRTVDPLIYGMFNHGVVTSDLYLMLAEAYARHEKPDNALMVLNKFAKNRYDVSRFIPYTYTSKENLISDILKERRLETVLSGTRWFDMRRLFVLGECDDTIVRYDKDGVEIGRMKPSLDRMPLPIPEKVMAINPAIKPNVQ